jgi:hypothetical protein
MANNSSKRSLKEEQNALHNGIIVLSFVLLFALSFCLSLCVFNIYIVFNGMFAVKLASSNEKGNTTSSSLPSSRGFSIAEGSLFRWPNARPPSHSLQPELRGSRRPKSKGDPKLKTYTFLTLAQLGLFYPQFFPRDEAY